MKRFESHRFLRVLITFVLLFGAATAQVHAQAALPRISLPEMAQAIARTINANGARLSEGAMAFDSATAHENVVEILYQAKETPFFANVKASLDKFKIGMSRYICGNATRLLIVNAGVDFHIVMLAPDKSDRIQFTVDRPSCAQLPAPKLANFETLARIAKTVASKEEKEKSSSSSRQLIQSVAASVQGSSVELNSAVAASPIWSDALKHHQIMALILGYYCGKYGDEISQGLAIDDKLMLPDGSLVGDVTIDRTACGSRAN